MQEELLRRGLKLGDNGIEVREYIYDMPLVMAAADLVLCRAGASTISELTAIAKPAVLVPSPNVTANHQEKNAQVLASQGAGILLREADCVQGPPGGDGKGPSGHGRPQRGGEDLRDPAGDYEITKRPRCA